MKINRKRSLSARLSAPGLRIFFRIADLWKIREDAQTAILGLRSHRTLQDWRAHPERQHVGIGVLMRISHILGIFKALQRLLPAEEAADSWVRRPNSARLFGGRPPIRVLATGKMEKIRQVRKHLEDFHKYLC